MRSKRNTTIEADREESTSSKNPDIDIIIPETQRRDSIKVFSLTFGLSKKIKILNVEIRVIKSKQILCSDKTGYTKGLRQNFVLDFVITLRMLPKLR